MAKARNRYSRLIEYIFAQKYTEGAREIIFQCEDLVSAANQLGMRLPKNLGDIVYSFRYRAALPDSIRKCAPEDLEWVIRPIGQAKYEFSLATMPKILPNALLAETKIPDATPGIIMKYAVNDE